MAATGSRLLGKDGILTDAPLDQQNWAAHHTTEKQRRDWCPEVSEHTARRPLLDKASLPHPLLNMLMDAALTSIMLVSDGAVMALKVRTTGSRAEASAPTSDLAVTIDKLGESYMACKTHRQRLTVIKEAQDTSDRLRYSPKSAIVIKGTREYREAVATDPRPRRVVAADYRLSSKTITAYRKEFGR